jgi:ERCC4-type nuclease
MLTIQIDDRETDLLKNIDFLKETSDSFKDLVVEVKHLSLGDILFVEKREKLEEEEPFIHLLIERKTLGDLVASIKDGRYEEQSYRLNALGLPHHNILYLIEGDISKRNFFKENKQEKQMIFTSLFSLNFYKGFSVIRTLNLEESAFFILNSADKLQKALVQGKKPFYNVTPSSLSNSDKEGFEQPIVEKGYASVVKKVKKDNITAENIGEILLSQIPGISSITALAIMKKCGTISNLIQMIQTDKDFLKGISYLDHKGKPRKISKKSIETIYTLLREP